MVKRLDKLLKKHEKKRAEEEENVRGAGRGAALAAEAASARAARRNIATRRGGRSNARDRGNDGECVSAHPGASWNRRHVDGIRLDRSPGGPPGIQGRLPR